MSLFSIQHMMHISDTKLRAVAASWCCLHVTFLPVGVHCCTTACRWCTMVGVCKGGRCRHAGGVLHCNPVAVSASRVN